MSQIKNLYPDDQAARIRGWFFQGVDDMSVNWEEAEYTKEEIVAYERSDSEVTEEWVSVDDLYAYDEFWS